MKPLGAIASIVAGLFAAPILACSPEAGAGGPGDVRIDQGSMQSHTDQLARPQPQTSGQPGEPSATSPAPGAFPRSFLIPGTTTSIRIGGSVDATGTYYSR